jgi:catechol 2,3-dioxygenase-like lactoylglutathione lyase family enzyme
VSGALEQTDHVGYTVADLDRSVEFWSYLLQREPKARKTWDVPYLGRIQGYEDLTVEAAFFDLPGGLTLELIRYHNPTHETVDMETYNVGNAHLSFVTHNLHQTFERLRGRAELRSTDPVMIEWGPYEGGYAARVRDPDGITIELVQLPEGGVKL